jgi:hypothetical protein
MIAWLDTEQDPLVSAYQAKGATYDYETGHVEGQD